MNATRQTRCKDIGKVTGLGFRVLDWASGFQSRVSGFVVRVSGVLVSIGRVPLGAWSISLVGFRASNVGFRCLEKHVRGVGVSGTAGHAVKIWKWGSWGSAGTLNPHPISDSLGWWGTGERAVDVLGEVCKLLDSLVEGREISLSSSLARSLHFLERRAAPGRAPSETHLVELLLRHVVELVDVLECPLLHLCLLDRPRLQGVERDFVMGNLLIRIQSTSKMVWWTGLAPWELESLFPGSRTATLLGARGEKRGRGTSPIRNSVPLGPYMSNRLGATWQS